MKDDVTRIAAYVAKTVPTTVSLKVASVLSGMKSGFAASIVDFVADEVAIQTILNAAGTVPGLMYPCYMNFGREIRARRARGIDGAALLAMAEGLSTKYQSYGCAEIIIKDIATTVYSLTLA